MNGPDNNIGWTSYTHNPITGCKHGCRFGPDKAVCYAEVIAERFRGSKAFPNGFDPEFHPERLSQPGKVKIPARIFVCSMADLFGSWVPDEWIIPVIESFSIYHWHTFQLLTKAPWNALKWKFPDNVWLGATITGGLGQEDKRLECVKNFPARVRFLSCEPMEGPVDVSKADPHWVIIGAATGKGGYQPKREWIHPIEQWCNENGVPIFHKDNLDISLTLGGKRRMEFPEEKLSHVGR